MSGSSSESIGQSESEFMGKIRLRRKALGRKVEEKVLGTKAEEKVLGMRTEEKRRRTARLPTRPKRILSRMI